MREFRTTFFNGYQKADVDDYVNSLAAEVERLQKLGEGGAEKERTIRELTERLESREEELRAAKERQKRLEEECCRLRAVEENFSEIEEQLKKYEGGYSNFMDLMVSMKAQAREMVQEASRNAEEIINLAQRDAEKITSEAQAGAQDIAADAKIKAEKYWMNAEQEIAQKRKEEEESLKETQDRIEHYIASLKRSRGSLLEVYEQLGNVVGQLPLRLGDVFSDEPFELLDYDGKKRDEKDVGEGSSIEN